MKKGKIMRTRDAKRNFSVLSGAIVLSMSMFGVVSAAQAAPGDMGTGSITVHKFAEPDSATGLPNDGNAIDEGDLDGLTALDGVGFTVVPIEGLPLGTAANWDKLKDLVVTTDAGGNPILSGVTGASLGTPLAEIDTSNGGIAEFANLPADKAYVVYESTPLPSTVTVAQPAIVTVPYPGDAANPWNYDIHIYPKNVVLNNGSSKNATVIGNQITFDISYLINNLGADEQGDPVFYTQFMISDALSAGLTYVSSTVSLVDGTTVTTVPNTEYTLNTSGNPLTLTFDNADGDDVLTFLQNNIGKTVKWTIVTTADAAATSTSNTADLTVNGDTFPVSVPEPQAIFSGATIKKEANNKGASANVPLGGAGFEVWSKPNAGAISACPAYADLDVDVDGLVKADLGTLTSNATTGLTSEMVLGAGDYCVYETVVPAGYKGALGGAKLTIAADDAQVTIVNDQFGTSGGDLPGLPITGAAGRVLMIIAGGAVLFLAIGLFFVRRRRDAGENEQ